MNNIPTVSVVHSCVCALWLGSGLGLGLQLGLGLGVGLGLWSCVFLKIDTAP